jgi:hypothetical protein
MINPKLNNPKLQKLANPKLEKVSGRSVVCPHTYELKNRTLVCATCGYRLSK